MAGVYGDRIYAFLDSAGHRGFPYLTGATGPRCCGTGRAFAIRESHRSRPICRTPWSSPSFRRSIQVWLSLKWTVDTPSGQTLAVDDPALLAMLAGERSSSRLSLLRSHRTMTDCRPVSLISLETIEQLGGEANAPLDKRRFRANIYAQLGTAKGFGEDAFVGRRLQIGSRASSPCWSKMHDAK